MILAAGEGRRLRPLTDTTPKPLLAVGGKPLLGRTLRWLADMGFERIVINAHHRAALVQDFVHAAQLEIAATLLVSTEIELLGTGGGIRQAAEHWPAEGAWIVNGDVICDIRLGDIDVDKSDALMVVRHDAAAAKLGPIYLAAGDTQVCGILDRGQTSGTPLMFTGIHYISTPLAKSLPERGCVIRDGYIHWLAAQRIGAHVHSGYWNEIGTPSAYAAIAADDAAGRLTWL